jgi:NADH-quinone oxidoreductase subunit G
MSEQDEAAAVELVELTIDERPVSVPKGSVIWAAAQKLGIEIPIYCYHPKMEPLGACRMCFVAVENMPKLATACTTTVSPGMAVYTNTPAVKKARQGTLEFLLINHPLDCPICDKGGECDLQDFALRYGPGASRFDLRKRHFEKPVPVSENILLDRERCIACQRCVRFCQTVAMEDGLIMEERGFRTQVGVDPDAPFDSIYSGNVVEMCPVGALTAKSYRFVSRPWELTRTDSVCGNCSVGCNVRVDVRVDKVLRQYSRTNDRIDDGWLCDRGRWDLERINSLERLRTPLIRSGESGKLQPATWEEALTLIASRLHEIKDRYGSGAIGGIGGTHTTNEEAYLFQKLLRAGLATNNVDHRHGRFPPAGSQSVLPWVWSDSIAGLEKASHIVLLGADPYNRQPLVDLRIRKAIRNGARVYVVTAVPNRLDSLATGVIRYASGQTGAVAQALLQLVTGEGLARRSFAEAKVAGGQSPSAAEISSSPGTVENLARSAEVDVAELRRLAQEIAGARGAVFLYDEVATLEPGAATLASDLLRLALLTDNFGRPGAGVGPLFKDNNSLGARDMGLLPDSFPGYRLVTDASAREALGRAWNTTLPDSVGLSYDQMLSGSLKALYVMGADPVASVTSQQLAALGELDLLVVQDMFLTQTAARASVVLPAVSQLEKDGTLTNTERCIQVVRQAMQPLPGAKADWEILRGVARALGLHWSYLGSTDILKEIGRVTPIYDGVSRRGLGESGARWPLVRKAEAETKGSASSSTPRLRETTYLTWQMLEQGVSPVGVVAGDVHRLVVEAGRGESE